MPTGTLSQSHCTTSPQRADTLLKTIILPVKLRRDKITRGKRKRRALAPISQNPATLPIHSAWAKEALKIMQDYKKREGRGDFASKPGYNKLRDLTALYSKSTEQPMPAKQSCFVREPKRRSSIQEKKGVTPWFMSSTEGPCKSNNKYRIKHFKLNWLGLWGSPLQQTVVLKLNWFEVK